MTVNQELEKQIRVKRDQVCKAIEINKPLLARQRIKELIALCNKRPRK